MKEPERAGRSRSTRTLEKNMRHEHYWASTSDREQFERARDCEVEVAVVGAGITGLTSGCLLAKDGRSVAIIEMHNVGGGESGHTTAHLTWLLDSTPSELRKAASESTGLILGAHASAVDEIERICNVEGIGCEFKRVDAYVLGLERGDQDRLRQQVMDLQRYGRECSFIEPSGAPFGAPGGAIKAAHQAKLHPMKYLNGLARAARAAGAFIFQDSKVSEREYRGEWWYLRTATGTIKAKNLILATHSPAGLVASLQTRLEPYNTYAIAARIPKGYIPEASYFDTLEPYNYTRVEEREDHAVAIVGGRDHRTGKTPTDRDPHDELAQYLRRVFKVPDAQVTHRWAGEVLEPVDSLAFIGRMPRFEGDRQFVATGYSGNGMTYGTVAAMILRDLVAGRDHPWASVFDPKRINLRAGAVEFVKANLEVAHDFVVGHLGHADLKSAEEVPRGHGQIVKILGKKRAVYRDENGIVTVLSPNCTHMGCLVAWNHIERSWDCSCHGSRFTPQGEVTTGPAVKPLLEVYNQGDRGNKSGKES